MLRHLISFFDIDKLVTKPICGINSRSLPSPEALKYKVLIRVCINLSMLEYSSLYFGLLEQSYKNFESKSDAKRRSL
jgi:hypothetical protein